MNRDQARTVVMLIAAWVMGALLGSQVQRPAARSNPPDGTVRFPPGRYLLEEAGDPWGAVIMFNNAWYVRRLPMPPDEAPPTEAVPR